jgi:hypothetical protein
MSISGSRGIPIIVAAAILLIALEVPAQQQAVWEVMQRYGLIGTFARDCATPVGKQNPYAVYTVVNANLVRYDLLTSSTERASVGVLDTATELSRNELGISYAGQRGRIDIVYRIDANRFRLWTSTRQDGEKLVINGRYMPENVETPWLTRCD